MQKIKKTLMFNAKTGVLIGALPNETPTANLDLTKFKFKEVETDPINEFWDGDYDTGKLKSIDEKPRYSEVGVDGATAFAIESKYPIHKQLNIIIDMINKSDMPNTPEFTAMMEHIADTIKLGKEKKQTYKDSDAFDYVSEEDIQEFAKKAVDL